MWEWKQAFLWVVMGKVTPKNSARDSGSPEAFGDKALNRPV